MSSGVSAFRCALSRVSIGADEGKLSVGRRIDEAYASWWVTMVLTTR